LKEEALYRTMWRNGFGRGKIFITFLVKERNTKIVTDLSEYVTRSK